MNKGVVMEINDKHIIVMTADGRFERLARKSRQCQVGEEIVFADTRVNWKSVSFAGKSAIAAAIVFCVVLFGSFVGKLSVPSVVAYVSMDINPSVEMGIDEKETVLELKGLNEDGAELVQSVDFKGKRLEDVTGTLLDKAESKALARGEGEIVIASTVVQDNANINDTVLAQKLKEQVVSHIKTTHPDRYNDYQVTAFAAPQEIRETAKQNGISMGKYAVYLNAKNNGEPVTIDEFKQESVLQLVKDKSLDKAVVSEESLNKATIKQLLEEEKSGKLDKKVEESRKNRNKDNKSGDKKPATNSGNNNDKTNANDRNDKSDKNDKNSKNDKNNGNDKNSKDNNNKSDKTDKTGRNSNKNDDNNDKDKDDKSDGKPDSSSPGNSSRPGSSGATQPVTKPSGNQNQGGSSGKQQNNGKDDNEKKSDKELNKEDDSKITDDGKKSGGNKQDSRQQDHGGKKEDSKGRSDDKNHRNSGKKDNPSSDNNDKDENKRD